MLIEPHHEKTNILVSDLVRHKPGCTATVQAAKRLYPSRLRTWNFASHVTFLRGFCEEVAWVLRGISVSFAKFCEIFFVERGKQA